MAKINLSEFDIIIPHTISVDIVRKVRGKWRGKWIGEIARSRGHFGLRNYYFKRNKEEPKESPLAIPCYTVRRKIHYFNKNNLIKNANFLNDWKVAVPNAYGASYTLPVHQIFLIESGAICTETYSIIDMFKTEQEAKKLIQYLKTDFVRFLLGLRKITQDIPKDRWNWVPYVDLRLEWTDAKLYEYFGISPEEQLHIKATL